MDSLATFLATCGPLGTFGRGSGTVGALVGLIIFLFLQFVFPFSWGIVIVAGATGLAVWSADKAEKAFKRVDDQRIVIDEVAGMMIALLFIPVTWLYLLAGFVLFRFFDIVKPLGIKKLQKLPGGIGIVADDLAAGIAANIVLHIIGRVIRS